MRHVDLGAERNRHGLADAEHLAQGIAGVRDVREGAVELDVVVVAPLGELDPAGPVDAVRIDAHATFR